MKTASRASRRSSVATSGGASSVAVASSANDDRLLPVLAPGPSPFHRSAMSSLWMRSWSSTMPSSSASGRGGQPGTYTSTGTIWSTPLVTE